MAYGDGVGAGVNEDCGEAIAIAGAGVALAALCGAALGGAMVPPPAPPAEEDVLDGAPGAPGIAGRLYDAFPKLVVATVVPGIGLLPGSIPPVHTEVPPCAQVPIALWGRAFIWSRRTSAAIPCDRSWR